MDKLQSFCKAIEKIEGYYPGSRAWRNNNPGNLRYSKFQAGVKDGYSYFNSYNEGFNALMYDIKRKCLGQTRTGLGPESNFVDFAHVWAPSWDKNDPDAYSIALGIYTKMSELTKLKEIYNEKALTPPEESPTTFSTLPQKILCVLVNSPNPMTQGAIQALKRWFDDLGVGTYIDIVTKDATLKMKMARGFTGTDNTKLIDIKIIDPDLVKTLITDDLDAHNFVIFIYRSGGQLTPTEFSQLYLGANIIQLPVLDVSTTDYILEFLVHEILHGWYARLGYNNIFLQDKVHAMPYLAGFAEIVKELSVYKSTIFRQFTREEKIYGLRQAISDLWNYLISLLS